MSAPSLIVVRHGATDWSTEGRHTSRTDVALTADGERDATAVGHRLASRRFVLVLTSPRRRARETARLAGFPEALVDADLAEWDYGEEEGRTTAEIRGERPGWDPWRDGFPGGEALASVAARADAVIGRVEAAGGQVLAFAHAHVLRVLAARWVRRPPEFGRHITLDPATISELGWYREDRVIAEWNSRGR